MFLNAYDVLRYSVLCRSINQVQNERFWYYMYNPDEKTVGRASCRRCARDNEFSGDETTAREVVEETIGDYGCGENSSSTWGLRGYPLAQVYSPLQNFTEIYDCENALTRGTIFAQLDLPFVCGGMSGGVSRG
jgi:hypothetical protein